MKDKTKNPKEPLEAVYEEPTSTQAEAELTERDIEAEIQELKDQNLRLYAEFENFRRRNARERLELMSVAGEKVIKSVLPVLDDF